MVPPGAAPAARILASCRGDPGEEVRAGRFLADLYFSLSTLTISLPPLRERLAELPGLVERIVKAEIERVSRGR